MPGGDIKLVGMCHSNDLRETQKSWFLKGFLKGISKIYPQN